jgi:hypothetical protein
MIMMAALLTGCGTRSQQWDAVCNADACVLHGDKPVNMLLVLDGNEYLGPDAKACYRHGDDYFFVRDNQIGWGPECWIALLNWSYPNHTLSMNPAIANIGVGFSDNQWSGDPAAEMNRHRLSNIGKD